MPAHALDAVFFVQDQAKIELVDGLIHIAYNIGKNARFEVVLTPAVFFKSLRCANRIADEFHAKESVVPIRRGREQH